MTISLVCLYCRKLEEMRTLPPVKLQNASVTYKVLNSKLQTFLQDDTQVSPVPVFVHLLPLIFISYTIVIMYYFLSPSGNGLFLVPLAEYNVSNTTVILDYLIHLW